MLFGYKKLVAWRKADDLAYDIYTATNIFPRSELFGLTSQLRRAALSIPTNIAEGYGRQSKSEFKRFLKIAIGSLFEVEYLLSFSLKLSYFTEEDYFKLQNLRHDVGALLWSLYKSF